MLGTPLSRIQIFQYLLEININNFRTAGKEPHSPVEFNSKTQVSNTTTSIFLDEDVFAL